jgi:hypothetical protein
MRLLKFKLDDATIKKLVDTTHRRYGDDIEARAKIMGDILGWHFERWDKGTITTGESFWLVLTTSRINWFASIAYAKLIKRYFQD